jgi:hypothetical protein
VVSVVGPFSNNEPITLTAGLIGTLTHPSLDTEKTAVVNAEVGRVYYRYIVDGNEQYDPDKPNELFECTLLFHYHS